MAKINGLGYNEQTLRLCIEGASGFRVWGHVVSMRLSAPIDFSDLGEFVMKMDAVMDEQNFPQSFQRKREFKTASSRYSQLIKPFVDGDPMTKQQVEDACGTLATLDVRVLARQSASWQGHVLLPDCEKPADFESDLELIQILVDYLGEINLG